MHAHHPAVSQAHPRARPKGIVSKFLKLLIFLLVFAAWVSGSSPTLSAGSSFQTGASVQSGGAYVLTLQPVPTTAPTSYVLLETAPQVDPAPGCCCKVCLPSILR
jgi:hypothetical protein